MRSIRAPAEGTAQAVPQRAETVGEVGHAEYGVLKSSSAPLPATAPLVAWRTQHELSTRGSPVRRSTADRDPAESGTDPRCVRGAGGDGPGRSQSDAGRRGQGSAAGGGAPRVGAAGVAGVAPCGGAGGWSGYACGRGGVGGR